MVVSKLHPGGRERCSSEIDGIDGCILMARKGQKVQGHRSSDGSAIVEVNSQTGSQWSRSLWIRHLASHPRPRQILHETLVQEGWNTNTTLGEVEKGSSRCKRL